MRMGESLRDKLAPIYRPLLSELFDRAEVNEPRATCDDCAMCDKGAGPDALKLDYFRPDTKCCTYYPSLPNYLVGAILSDPDPALDDGKRRIRERIALRTGVTPAWIAAPRLYTAISMAASGAFGRSKKMTCPYLTDDARCSIWRHREAVCSTFFCKYNRGRRGYEFWSAMKMYLGNVEVELGQWAMKGIDSSLEDVRERKLRLTVEDIEGLPPREETYAAIWKDWLGREEELYIACYERVNAMTRDEFARVCDRSRDGTRHVKTLTQKWDRLLSDELPQSLIRNPKMLRVLPNGDNVVVTAFNANDSFALDKDLYDVLAMLDGKKSVEENLAWLAKEHGIELTSDLLNHLYIHGVLVAPPKTVDTDLCATS